MKAAVNITIQEAQILQSYPSTFTFAGNKGKQVLQIGNAVPPLLAEAILDALWAPATPPIPCEQHAPHANPHPLADPNRITQ